MIDKYITQIVLGLLVISILTVPNAAAEVPVSKTVTVEEKMIASDNMDVDFSRIKINPPYSNMQIKPGNSDEVTVTVTNKNNETITVAPFVSISPYSENFFEESWVTITPVSVDIAPDAKQEFVIKVNIPQDVDIGYYYTSIAFTEDVMPTPYPNLYPNYVNSMSFSVDVWTPPNIQIMTPYISGRVESGETYDYEIKLKNIADKDISIDPKIDDNNRMYDYYGSYSTVYSALEDDAITITAPSVVKAGETAIVKVHLEVPDNAKGRYNGVIDLNIDDPSIREYEGQVQMNFIVWTQPLTPYEKSFTSNIDALITIRLNSQQNSYDRWMGTNTQKDEELSFEKTLIDPSGNEVEMTLIKTTYGGTVNIGMYDSPPWEMDSEGIYQEVQTSYSEIYTAPGLVGDWTLKVLPLNAETFSYSIMMESSE
ncbi:MAG: hypothetical protein JXA38_06225 [Methanosarcinaceae archaeon]|nr:hypothetical protein [Methanosarcinaceae archaeon]